MGAETILIALVLLCGFYVAWNIGANDVANAMGTSVGSGALTLRNAVILAAIFEFTGAFIVGSNVSKTVRKGIFDPGKLVQTVDVETPEMSGVTAIKLIAKDGDPVKANDPLFELTMGAETQTITAPVDGHFALKDIKDVAEDAIVKHTYDIQLNRKRSSIVLACGMIAALLAAGTWLMTATWMSWPVSTTHSIVGAVVGFGCIAVGIDGVAWDKVGFIASGWIISPLISGAVAYIVFGILLKTVFHKRNPLAAAKKVAPNLVFILMFVMTGMTCYKGLKPLWGRLNYDPKDPSFMIAVAVIACVIGVIGYWITKFSVRNLKKIEPDDAADGSKPASSNPVLDAEVSRSLAKTIKHLQRVRNTADGDMQEKAAALLSDAESLQKQALDQITTNTDSAELQQVERVFTVLQILTACLVAFAHGSNDVANAIGPLSAAYQAIEGGAIAAKSTTPLWALGLGGVGIVIGLWTWGWKVIKTVGEKITELTPSRGFCAEFAAAITILLASVLPFGLPISTTHTLVGAVLGVGLARGIGALNLRTMREIVAGWIITIPAGAGLCVLFYFILKLVFIDSGWAV